MTRMNRPERRKRPTSDDLFELMSVLSHDLRTPLTPVKGYAEIMRTRAHALGPDKTVQYATIIVDAAARMERSIDLLSGISALYGGRADIQQVPVRPANLVAERLDIWRGREPQRVFQADAAAASGGVLADRGWLGKALDIFVDQALRTWPAPATIVLSAVSHPNGQTTSLRVGALGIANVAGAAATGRLGRAFVVAVADVCGYSLTGDLEIELPVTQEP